MGIISSIRKRSGLLIVLVGLGVGGFIVMDVVQNRSMMNSVATVGTVNGKSFEFNEMRQMEDILYQGSQADEYAKREYLWDFFVENSIITEVAEKTGLNVGKEELLDLQFGSKLSPIISSRYGNPQTGQVDMAQLQQIKTSISSNTLDPNIAPFWAIQEREIIKERLHEKLNNLFTKAVYTPSWLAESILKDQMDPVNALFVKVPATFVSDADVKLTDADFQKFIYSKKSKYTYPTEKRVVSFVQVQVVPSSKDTADAMTSISSRIDEFRNAENDSSFVLNNNGIISDMFVKANALSPVISDRISSMSVGDVYGPYIDNELVMAVKLIGRTTVADSVKSRHILISASTPQELEVASQRIDSIETVIKSGRGSFAELARTLSTDTGSGSMGGDLGYSAQGRMVKPFNDALFFDSRVGQLKKVTTQFGVHLLEIQDKKTVGDGMSYKVAYLNSELLPSEETQSNILSQTEALIDDVSTLTQLEEKLKTYPGLNLQHSFEMEAADYRIQGLPSGQSARDIVKWAFSDNVKKDEVAKTVFPIQEAGKYYIEGYVIAGLRNIKPKGVGTASAMREELQEEVMNQKKVEILAEQAKGLNSMQTLADKFNVAIDTSKAIVFSSTFVPGIGNEPMVAAMAYTLPLNTVSPLISGKTGIYLIQPYERTSMGTAPDLSNAKRFYTNTIRQQAGQSKLMDALKKKSKIDDNRAKIF